MKRLLACLSCVAVLASASLGAAPILSLERVESGTVTVGDSITFALRVAGLDTLLGAFSAELAYDASRLIVNGAAFGDRLGHPPTEADVFFDASTAGQLHLDEISLLGTSELGLLQRNPATNDLLGSFVLALLRFDAIAPGIVGLLPVDATLADALGDALPAAALNGTALVIAAVPLPGTLALLGIACAIVCLIRRREHPVP